jgi:chromosome segregation ATPase
MAEKTKAELETEISAERTLRQDAETRATTAEARATAAETRATNAEARATAAEAQVTEATNEAKQHLATIGDAEKIISDLQAENASQALKLAAANSAGKGPATVTVDGDIYRVIAPFVAFGQRKVAAEDLTEADARLLLAEGSELLVKVVAE